MRIESRMLARQRIRICYWARHGRSVDLDAPARFTEFVQHRKLHDRRPELPALADKVAVKAHVASRIGAKWVTPSLWQGTDLPLAPPCPLPIVIKSRHGCRQIAFVHSDRDWATARRRSRHWVQSRYGWWLDEWLYGEIPRGLLAEPFLGTGGHLPIDYKFYVFGGRVEAIQVHLDRAGAHRWLLFDRKWRRMSCLQGDSPAPPRALATMIDAAETLGAGHDFVRVDLYELADGPRFGEMTFYPGSGLDRFDPVALDTGLGQLWAAARAARHRGLLAVAA